MILDSIANPRDIKNLSLQQLEILCDELRSEIIRITTKNGGHLGSNLGCLELTVAMHYVFDSPNDRIIFDVGHQSYAHKLLTGRREIMENLRCDGGASGFLNPKESDHDQFVSGHASTSMSAALGIAASRDLDGKDYSVITLIGDGSMSGGMSFEAMNNIGNAKKFVVILNDNQMSISETVGGMRKYLSKLLASKNILCVRKSIRSFLSKLPKKISTPIERVIKALILAIKGGTIFEEFGFQYIGPVDGHNLKTLIDVLKNVRDFASYKPVLLHTFTNKGMGYEPAIGDAYKLHGVLGGEKSCSKPLYTDVFGKKITDLARSDKKIVCITAAMKSGCGLSEFANAFPERFFDVGIAEEHAVTFAAGLAKAGHSPFVCLYSTFLQRSFDQIYHDVVLQNLPVRFIIDKAGVPGKDGQTHSGIYDMAMLSLFENFQIFAPSNIADLEESMSFAATYNNGPLAIRFPKSEAFDKFDSHLLSLDQCFGGNVLVLSVGDMLPTIYEAINIANVVDVNIVDIYKVFPFNYEKFSKQSKEYKKILVLEEGVYGGFSSLLLEYVSKNKDNDLFKKLHILNIPKTPLTHASRKRQMEICGMSAHAIAKLFV